MQSFFNGEEAKCGERLETDSIIGSADALHLFKIGGGVWCFMRLSAWLTQLVEHLACKQGIAGSSPASGTLFPP